MHTPHSKSECASWEEEQAATASLVCMDTYSMPKDGRLHPRARPITAPVKAGFPPPAPGRAPMICCLVAVVERLASTSCCCCDAARALVMGKPATPATDESPFAHFIDHDGEMKLDLEEFIEMQPVRIREIHTREQMQEWYQAADENGDGKLSVNEFFSCALLISNILAPKCRPASVSTASVSPAHVLVLPPLCATR